MLELNSVFICFTRIAVLSGLWLSVTAQAQYAESVWVESGDSVNQLLFSRLSDDEWSVPQLLYSSKNPISRPAMASLSAGTKILIWSEQQALRSVLMSSIKAAKSDKWQQPSLFNALGKENTGAVVLADLTDRLWVFWASNNNGLDDIYYIRQVSDKQAVNEIKLGEPVLNWTKPERVNAQNDVPDHLPFANNLPNGDIQLAWSTFNVVSLSYQTDTRLFALNLSPQWHIDEQQQRKELQLNDVNLPPQLTNFTSGLVHFPTNRLTQNYVFNIGVQ